MEARMLKETKFSSQQHCKHLNKSLNAFRQQKQFCDIELIVEGKTFSAHMAVLAGVSCYFEKLFTIDMKEKRERKVEMEKVSCAIMEDFLHYIYTGDVFLTKAKAIELLKAANYTDILTLKRLCEDFLIENLSLQDCFHLGRLADMYNSEKLYAACCYFKKKNFRAIMELKEFLEMGEEELEFYLKSDDIVVEDEQEVYEGLLKWVTNKPEERKNHFTKLFSYIRLCSISKQFLFSVVAEEDMVCSSRNCSKMALKALSLSTSFQAIQRPRRCLEKTLPTIFICGGCSEDEYYTMDSFCYAPRTNKWCKLTPLNERRNSLATVELDGFLYVLGGMRPEPPSILYDTAINDVSRYDFRNNTWSSVASMPHAMVSPSAITLNGCIYVLAGYNMNGENGHVMQKYCPTTNRWMIVTPPTVPRKNASCASDEVNIFIIGGELSGNTEREGEILDSCEKYFPKCNRWKAMPPMNIKRSHAAAAFYRQKIFVFGGCAKPDETTDLCEMYSISLECWSRIASLPVPRRCASAVVVDNAIYLLCGEDDDQHCVNAVERYREEDGWITVAQMPTGRSLTNASRLTFANVFLESCENFR